MPTSLRLTTRCGTLARRLPHNRAMCQHRSVAAGRTVCRGESPTRPHHSVHTTRTPARRSPRRWPRSGGGMAPTAGWRLDRPADAFSLGQFPSLVEIKRREGCQELLTPQPITLDGACLPASGQGRMCCISHKARAPIVIGEAEMSWGQIHRGKRKGEGNNNHQGYYP